MYIPIDDKLSQNISLYFDKCINFIEKSRKKTNVLVHCRAGISNDLMGVVLRRERYDEAFDVFNPFSDIKNNSPVKKADIE